MLAGGACAGKKSLRGYLLPCLAEGTSLAPGRASIRVDSRLSALCCSTITNLRRNTTPRLRNVIHSRKNLDSKAYLEMLFGQRLMPFRPHLMQFRSHFRTRVKKVSSAPRRQVSREPWNPGGPGSVHASCLCCFGWRRSTLRSSDV
jgi:hypothetical protein